MSNSIQIGIVRKGDSPWSVATRSLKAQKKDATNTAIVAEMKRLAELNNCEDVDDFSKKFFYGKLGKEYVISDDKQLSSAAESAPTTPTAPAKPKGSQPTPTVSTAPANPQASQPTPTAPTAPFTPRIFKPQDPLSVVPTNPKTNQGTDAKKTGGIGQFTPISQFTSSSSITGSNQPIDIDILNQAFDNSIRDLMRKGGKSKSVLIGTAGDFVQAASQQNVDPFALMGISMLESTYGTSRMALTKNNVGGLTPNGRDGIHCQTVADSIGIAAKTLHKNVHDKGLTSISSVGARGNYCVASADTRAQWTKNVTFMADKVRKEYNRLLQQQ